MAAALEDDGWSGGRSGDRNNFHYDKSDDYGRWTVSITYTTEQPPPAARRVDAYLISPHAS